MGRASQRKSLLVITLFGVLMLSALLSACGEKSHTENNRTEVDQFYERDYSLQEGNEEHHYSIEEAKEYISWRYNHPVGDYYEIHQDIDGTFSCFIGIEDLEYTYLTISGGFEFIISFDESSNDWGVPYAEPMIDYEWKIPTGDFYAEAYSKNRYSGKISSPYYVYLNIIEFDGEKLHAVLEATYDSTDGGIGSCKPQDQVRTMRHNCDDLFDPVATFSRTGGYPEFVLSLTKNSISLYQNNNSDFACELIPN